MFKSISLFVMSLFISTNVFAVTSTTELFLLDKDGKKMRSIGTVQLKDSDKGLEITTKLTSLTPGVHGFHVHENPSCEPLVTNGVPSPAGAAGGHYDPAKTGKHEGPEGNGHLGDLPRVTIDKDGNSRQVLYAPRLKVADVKGRSIMMHVGGDNYSDAPASLGGGGSRMACGVTK
ncbi:MAG: superoxide dismutase [Cu-Zn] SodC [Desulfovibrionaceae bacterium]